MLTSRLVIMSYQSRWPSFQFVRQSKKKIQDLAKSVGTYIVGKQTKIGKNEILKIHSLVHLSTLNVFCMVLPVLHITRHYICRYNKFLRKKCAKNSSLTGLLNFILLIDPTKLSFFSIPSFLSFILSLLYFQFALSVILFFYFPYFSFTSNTLIFMLLCFNRHSLINWVV